VVHYSDIQSFFGVSLAPGRRAVFAKLRSMVDTGNSTAWLGRKKPYDWKNVDLLY
jgi:hypothetical protein